MKNKKIVIVLLFMALCLLLTGCFGPEATYKRGQTLLSKGKYTEALEKFETLGAFEDAAAFAKYCQAYIWCENGNYEAGIPVFEELGSFKDSEALVARYTALAGSGYTYKRAQDFLAKGQYTEAAKRFEGLGSYEDAATLTMYCKACALCENGDYETGLVVFEQLSDFKDCSYRITYYEARACEDEAGEDYWEGMLEAKAIYQTIPVFLDSADRMTALDTRIEAAKSAQYNTAVEAGENGEYGNARTAFLRLGDYQDSKSRYTYYGIRSDEDALVSTTDQDAVKRVADRYAALGEYLDCAARHESEMDHVTAILDSKYDAAVALMEEGKYREAITAFTEIKTHKDSAAQITACETAILDGKYDAAVALMNAGKYDEAYDAFVALEGHKDSTEKASSIWDKATKQKGSKANVGDYITFGTYEQDANTGNGKEDIEWLVLAKEDNRILVISRYGLDCKPYNDKNADVTWETCTLRKWLNNDFLNAAFNSAEKAMIPTVTVSADKNPDYNTKPGNATQDKVFLLSIPEANKYFTSGSARQCKPTAYAKGQGVWTYNSGVCWWWLRSPGHYQGSAAGVRDGGGIDVYGDFVYIGNDTVRPALWIDPEP